MARTDLFAERRRGFVFPALSRERALSATIWLSSLAGLFLLAVGFLIGPRLAPEWQQTVCVGNIDLPGPFGFGLNCDSPEFMWLAREPAALLNEQAPRQSRPGLILAASLLQKPLSFVFPAGAPPTPVGQGSQDTARIVQSLQDDLPAYIAYIILNVAMVIASLVFLCRIVQMRHESRRENVVQDLTQDLAIAAVVVASGWLLIANDVMKAFFWSPHTQLFNILAPLIALYATLRVSQGAFARRRFALSLGIATGLGMTAYAVFAVVVACVLPVAIWRLLRQREKGKYLANVLLFVVLSALPTLSWYAYVRATTGGFFQFELAQGEVVWMIDAWRDGVDTFLTQWFSNLVVLLDHAIPQAIAFLLFVLWLCIFLMRHEAARAAAFASWPVILAAIYVSLAVMGFYTSVGWIVDRLAYPIIPPLIAGAGAIAVAAAGAASHGARAALAGGCLLIAGAQMVFVVIKHGPWS